MGPTGDASAPRRPLRRNPIRRAIASDRLSNAAASAREVTALAPRRAGSAIEIDVDAEDRGSVRLEDFLPANI
jgi:hypothetical protein